MEKSRLCSSKYFILPVLILVCFSTIYFQPNFPVSTREEITALNTTIETRNVSVQVSSYLVDTPKCRIPNLDAWNADIKPFYKWERYIACSKKELLTNVEKNLTYAVVKINKKLEKLYSKTPVKCCYKNITRPTNVDVPDNHIQISECKEFNDEVVINDRSVMVTCRRNNEEVYANVHVAVTPNKTLYQKITSRTFKNTTNKPLSVLIIGIDSISRLNLMRTMPKTYSFLNDTGWIEYVGYNKIADNTFPNLIAALTGKPSEYAYKECNPKVAGKLDSCGFIWNDFRDLGYVTAYAEDEATLSTFNYKKKGFAKQPTDFYFRSYMYGASKLKAKFVDGMNYCTGPEMSGERILNLAKDFSTSFENHPTFSLFWMNSFSHNKLNSPTRLDRKVFDFLEDLTQKNVLNNTMVIFLSDHGLRFGKVRETVSGWLEERLPFLHFWIPQWFREKFPQECNNLKENAYQLSTPYDLYMTIQDILVFSNLNYTSKPSAGCPLCQSLFKKLMEPRACSEVGIEPHWCTCTDYKAISSDSDQVRKAIEFVIDNIQENIDKHGSEGHGCARFKLSKVITSSISTTYMNVYQNETYLLVIFETQPEATFESTVIVHENEFKEAGYVSRLDSYAKSSNCVTDSYLKMYCYCTHGS